MGLIERIYTDFLLKTSVNPLNPPNQWPMSCKMRL